MSALDLIERDALRRTDTDYLTIARSSAWVVPVWRSKNYVTGTRPPEAIRLEGKLAEAIIGAGADAIYLGTQSGRAVFAVDISHVEDPSSLGLDGRFSDLRMAGAFMNSAHAALLGYARAMCRWHRTAKHCSSCAGGLGFAEGGFARICESCGQKSFPRTDPAVMILITRRDECLLARQPKWPAGMYSALAGFIEPGESLEECVARETLEEVGLEVSSIGYFGSQPWPFPHQLMVGFTCSAKDGALVSLDDDELEEARWFTRTALQEAVAANSVFIPPPLSLAHTLIRSFLEHTPDI